MDDDEPYLWENTLPLMTTAGYGGCGNGSEALDFINESAANQFVQLINVINGLICLIGLTGNVLVFYVVVRFASMRTVTNVFILALALADIAFLVNIPFLIATALLENWPFGNTYCKIYYVMTTVNQFASSFFLVAMSADRYLLLLPAVIKSTVHRRLISYTYFAICLPYISRELRTPRTAFIVCSLIWLLAIILMAPVFLFAGTVSNDDNTETHCNIIWPDIPYVQGPQAFALYCFVLGFAFPVFFILIFYGLVIQRLRKRNCHNSRATPASQLSSRRQKSKIQRVSAMILVLILAFLTCWTPYWSYQLHITFGAGSRHWREEESTQLECDDSEESKEWVMYIALSLQCLCYANSAINPVLYAVLSKNFKQSYVKAWQCHVTFPRIHRRALFLDRGGRAPTTQADDDGNLNPARELSPRLQRTYSSRSCLKLQSQYYL